MFVSSLALPNHHLTLLRPVLLPPFILQVFMLPVDRCLDEACLQDILSRGHSRIPVYTAADR